MQGLLILLGLALLALPFVVLGLLVSTSRLRRRVESLESQVLRLLTSERLRESVEAPRPSPVPGSVAAEEPADEPAFAGPPRRSRRDIPDAPPPLPEPAAASVLPPPLPPVTPERRDWTGPLLAWLQANWVYVASAVSLGFAGIALVQYGAEHGLLTPPMRILLALALGAALVVAGEVIRRRWGDQGPTSTAVLPSTLSAAGITVLYAAILAARGLYGLIGPEVTFAGLLAVSLMALVFGWFYGPFLAAAGLTGGAAAPFLVGGQGGSPTALLLYFGLLTGSGLAIDALRRWGWVSGLALALAYGGGTMVWLGLEGDVAFAAFLLWLAFAAVTLPRLELWPSHPGPAILQTLLAERAEGAPGPVAPTWIAAVAVAVTSALLLLLGQGANGPLIPFGALSALATALLLSARRAEGLADTPLLPSAAFLLLIAVAAPSGFIFALDAPSRPSVVLALAALISLAAFLRSVGGSWPRLHAAAAALAAPVACAGLEFFWQPARLLGAWPWALHVLALAAAMTYAAHRYAVLDGEDRRRAAYPALSALSLLALSFFVLLSDAALTVALAVLVAAAAWLDRRFRLPEMGWFILAGIAALGWRLVVYPGLPAYLGPAPIWEVLLAYGSALLGLGGAMTLLPDARDRTRAALDSAFLAYGGVLLSVLLWRLVLTLDPGARELTHWSASLLGIIWATLALAQGFRARLGGPLASPRLVLAALEATAAIIAFILALTLFNPALSPAERVLGPQPLDTLLIAYALPGLLFAAAARRSPDTRFRLGFAWTSGGFFALWGALAIRRFWRGDILVVPGMTEAELTTYTVALLIVGGGLLQQSILRRSAGLRRVAMGVIGLAIAKVFLVDAAGLTGLLRVFSFLALGLVLAGLAWLNRWAAGHQDPREPPSNLPPAPLT